MNKTIAIIKGDGIGPEIVTEAMAVLDTVAAKFGHTFTYQDAPMGGNAIDTFGVPLPCCWAPWAAPSGMTSPPTSGRSGAC